MKKRGESWLKQRKEFMLDILRVAVQVGLWKWSSTYNSVRSSLYFVLKIKLLLNVLALKATLKDSAFWWVVCLTHNAWWSVNSLIINWLACLATWFGVSNTCGGVWLRTTMMKNTMRIVGSSRYGESQYQYLRWIRTGISLIQ